MIENTSSSCKGRQGQPKFRGEMELERSLGKKKSLVEPGEVGNGSWNGGRAGRKQ